MQRDVTSEKPIYTHYKVSIYYINIVMETGYRFAFKDIQSPLTERERTGTEPTKEDTSGSWNWPESCSSTWGKPTCCLNFTSLILKLDVLALII